MNHIINRIVSRRLRIEAVAGLVRGHLTSHLAHYRDEAVAIDDKLMGVTARCVKLEGEVNGRSVSTRGGSSGRGMREVITTLIKMVELVVQQAQLQRIHQRTVLQFKNSF